MAAHLERNAVVNVENILKKWEKKIISKTELERLLHTGSDAELYSLVSAAVNSGLLTPVKSSGTNGNKSYPLYLKYRITIVEDYSDALSEIAMLHPAINKTGYLGSKPEMYVKFRAPIQKLNLYLFRKQPEVSISKKERSFEIFGEEKQLEDKGFRSLLDRLDLTPDILCYYETPEYCFNDYIPERKTKMVLLILENKDIWFNIRRRMYEDGAFEILETRIDGAVYGAGNRVSEAGALSEYTRFMGAETVKYLYWGDIDRAGLNIFLSLLKNNPEIDIRLFVPAYAEMLHFTESLEIPDSDDHRKRMGNYEDIYTLFSDEDRDQLIKLIENNKRLPQEIINYESLLKMMR